MNKITILGAGPAGLTAGYIFAKRGADVSIFEGAESVGGLTRTTLYKGYRFDLGGHRFYTENDEIMSLVRELIGDDLLLVRGVNKIYMAGKLLNYPITFFNTISSMGFIKLSFMLFDYLSSRMRDMASPSPELSLDDWLIKRFGKYASKVFFTDYAEKIWGASSDRLSPRLAAERIQISLKDALKNMIVRSWKKPQTLIEWFYYPRLGFGRICERLAEEIGYSSIELSSRVAGLFHSDCKIKSMLVKGSEREREVECENVISTIPITGLLSMLSPKPDERILDIARNLKFRGLVIVFLIIKKDEVLKGMSEVYFPEKNIPFGRIHEPKKWSMDMVRDGTTSLVVEYFCSQGDSIWEKKDEDLKDMTVKELSKIGLIEESEVSDYKIVKAGRAYPVYDLDFEDNLKVLTDYLSKFENLQLTGRGGEFKYTTTAEHMEAAIKLAEDLVRTQSSAA
jgi:protoporphyrinogen oxidase